MNPRQASLLAVVLVLPTVAAVFIAIVLMQLSALSNLLFFCFTMLIAAVVIIEAMLRSLPQSLQKQSEDNCFRLNGTRSKRRTAAEDRARRKVRMDLWAVALLAGLVTGLGAAAVHFYVIPMPVAVSAATSFDANPNAWKANMKSQGVDRDLERHLQRQWRSSPREANAQARTLWTALPLLVVCGMLTAAAILCIVFRGYALTLREFKKGVLARQQKYTERDIREVQNAAQS